MRWAERPAAISRVVSWLATTLGKNGLDHAARRRARYCRQATVSVSSLDGRGDLSGPSLVPLTTAEPAFALYFLAFFNPQKKTQAGDKDKDKDKDQKPISSAGRLSQEEHCPSCPPLALISPRTSPTLPSPSSSSQHASALTPTPSSPPARRTITQTQGAFATPSPRTRPWTSLAARRSSAPRAPPTTALNPWPSSSVVSSPPTKSVSMYPTSTP